MIEGQRINLRAREDEDAVSFHRWFNDPEVTRFLGQPFPAVSMSQQRAFMASMSGDRDRRAYSIVLKNGTLIGNCELRAFNWTARSCELGIAIGEKQHWGQGYGGEAVDLLLRIGFEGLNLHKVWLTCAAYNQRGLRAYRRSGFREDGRLRDDRFIDGRYHDTVVMSVLEAEWRAITAQPDATAQ
jgi:RimJ/RimL family protein N-acetyltransferase